MKQIFIFENDSINLEKLDIDCAKEIIEKNPKLPFSVNGLTLNFSQYIVGSIQLKNTLIEIIPRNPAFSLENFFEMKYFTNTRFESDIFSSSYKQDSSFGIRSLASHFCIMCNNLLRNGLTGSIIEKTHSSMMINGNIIFEEFHKSKIPLDGIKLVEKQYTLDVLPNQIIKSALTKLLLAESNDKTRSNITAILREFDSINEYVGSLEKAEESILTFFSANRHYPIILENAIQILRDLKISYKNGNIEWSAFLENSNNIFEQYIRKVLEKGLEERVEKFKEDENFATIDLENEIVKRSYSPDIVIGHNYETGSCITVLDVKNKIFSKKLLSI